MKSAITHGKDDIALDVVPFPEASGYRCLCKILACASCSGTDVKITQNKLPFEVPYPSIPGHESVGVVVEEGKKTRYIKQGDRFLRPTAVYPGEKLGKYFSSWGGYAEYGLITDVKAFSEDFPGKELNFYTRFQQEVPPDIQAGPRDLTMLVTLKEAASFVSAAGAGFNLPVLILGTGPVAKAMCFFSKLYGACPVIVAGRRLSALEWVREAGADFIIDISRENLTSEVKDITAGEGAALILDTTGVPELLTGALNVLSSSGKAFPYATYPEQDSFASCDLSRFNFAGPSEDLAHEYLLYLLRKGVVDPGMFYTHTLSFEAISEGFNMLKERTTQKVVFEMEK